MKRRIKSIIGNTIGAIDGEIGKVKDFYFDDETWIVRYLIIETGNWMLGRKVLLSPQSIIMSDWEHDVFKVNLTKEQVFNSPNIDTNKPVNRQHENELHQYYPWNIYWNDLGLSGIPMPFSMLSPEKPLGEQDDLPFETHTDPHLNSTSQVTGYRIKAIDGDIGDVEDFILDDNSWAIDFIEIDTGTWLPGKKVILSPKLIKVIEWDTATVFLNTSVNHVKNSPEYFPGQQITDSYENGLLNHYKTIVHL